MQLCGPVWMLFPCVSNVGTQNSRKRASDTEVNIWYSPLKRPHPSGILKTEYSVIRQPRRR